MVRNVKRIKKDGQWKKQHIGNKEIKEIFLKDLGVESKIGVEKWEGNREVILREEEDKGSEITLKKVEERDEEGLLITDLRNQEDIRVISKGHPQMDLDRINMMIEEVWKKKWLNLRFIDVMITFVQLNLKQHLGMRILPTNKTDYVKS